MQQQRVLVILPVANGARTMSNAMESVVRQSWPRVQLVTVVDPRSNDDSLGIATGHSQHVLQVRGERSKKINEAFAAFGRSADWVFWLDADMIMSPRLIECLVSFSFSRDLGACYTSEQILGTSWTTRTRSFERHFFNGTPVDSFRWVSCAAFADVGGMSEEVFDIAGGEEWDLDARIRERVAFDFLDLSDHRQIEEWSPAVLGLVKRQSVKANLARVGILHDDGKLSLSDFLRKKWYYMGGLSAYTQAAENEARHHHRQMLNPLYRLVTVYVEQGKWRRVLRHPLMFLNVLALRLMVSLEYVAHKLTARRMSHGDPYGLSKS